MIARRKKGENMLRQFRFGLAAALATIGIAIVIGCTRQDTPAGDAQPPIVSVNASAKAADQDDHAHKAGAHSGIIVAIGRDNYHAEAVFERGGRLRLYTL